jgi:glycosyltransferase involved in cell wall biosynthesis
MPEQDRSPAVLMLAPLPPPAGGMATVAENLRTSHLAEACHLTVMDNAKRTPPGRSWRTGVAYQWTLLWEIRAALEHTQARIVHIHTCSGFTFWRDSAHMMLARWMGRKCVWHIHGAQFDQFVSSMSWLARAWYRRALRLSQAVIVLSEDWRRRLEPTATGVCWRILWNGTPIPTEIPAPAIAEASFLFVGTLEERKGPVDIIRAFAKIKRDGVPGTLTLLGGETAPGQKASLEALARQLGCRDYITLAGMLTGPPKDAAFHSANCFVMPSRAEGLPMAMLEAMACGIPVIATSVGAIPEAMTDGTEGFLVPPGDVDALADRMRRLGTDACLRERMGGAARERVEKDFSLERMCDKLLAIYQEVLSGGGRPLGKAAKEL